jgi:hypothetical protein
MLIGKIIMYINVVICIFEKIFLPVANGNRKVVMKMPMLWNMHEDQEQEVSTNSMASSPVEESAQGMWKRILRFYHLMVCFFEQGILKVLPFYNYKEDIQKVDRS